MICVKLRKLSVFKLYGSYCYDVDFNNDITFIYGLNGCGKTTVLNITEAIITGNLFNLFDYVFEKIDLLYYNDDTEDVISIKRNDNVLKVTFKDEKYEIFKIGDEEIEDSFSGNQFYKKMKRYFETNPVLQKINNTFNYVYLPLNRSTKYDMKYEDYRMAYRSPYYRRRVTSNLRNVPDSKRDKALNDIELLVMDTIVKMNTQIANINDTFRNTILKSSLDIVNDDLSDFKKHINEYDKNKIEKISKSYIKLLSDFNIVTDEEKEQYKDFFAQLIKESEMENSEDYNILGNLIFKYKELVRIERFTEIASKAEKQKERIRSNVKLFEETINRFIDNAEDHKKIAISNEGAIGFMTENSSDMISVHYLSSGERQLLIFFANLIFAVDNTKNGIFVVDEPELSLHLSWQKIFVESAIKINPNIQMIFATHSPEFVGKYRDRMFKLEKKYIVKEG